MSVKRGGLGSLLGDFGPGGPLGELGLGGSLLGCFLGPGSICGAHYDVCDEYGVCLW